MSQLKKRKSNALPQIDQQHSNINSSNRKYKKRLVKEEDDDESQSYDELDDDDDVQEMCYRNDKNVGRANGECKSELSSNVEFSQQKSGQQKGNNSCKRASLGSVRNQKYQKIHDDVRAQILFRCMVMNEPLKPLCKQLNINFSSAKNVIQVYKKEGRLNKKTSRLKRTENGELVERMDEISGDVICELKKKRCPVKVVRESIHGQIEVERNDEIYVPLSGRSGYDCIKVKQDISQHLEELQEQEFNQILLIAERELGKFNKS